jgi:HSP20 family molecular chaperone IbpA
MTTDDDLNTTNIKAPGEQTDKADTNKIPPPIPHHGHHPLGIKIAALLCVMVIFAACFAGGWLSANAVAQQTGEAAPSLLKSLTGIRKHPDSKVSTSLQDRAEAGTAASTASANPTQSSGPQSNINDPNDVIAQMERVQKQMDEAFDRAFQSMGAPPRGILRPGFGAGLMTPGMMTGSLGSGLFQQGMGVRDEGDHYTVEVSVPEADAPNVNVKLEGQQLTISSATDKTRKNTSANGAQSQSREVSSFQQSVTVHGPVKSQEMKVERQKDRVIITIPKA